MKADKKKSEEYKLFKPQLTPQKMLEDGCVWWFLFWTEKLKNIQNLWFKNAKLSKTFDIKKNRFRS